MHYGSQRKEKHEASYHSKKKEAQVKQNEKYEVNQNYHSPRQHKMENMMDFLHNYYKKITEQSWMHLERTYKQENINIVLENGTTLCDYECADAAH